MKRSDINAYIKYGMETLKKAQFPLPPFAYYSIDEWKNLGEDEIELVENMLGWDITDFGSNDFANVGLTIFTFRNGNFYDQEKYPKIYAEKFLLTRDSQILPWHYHWSKMEDIINRGGGELKVTMYNCTEEDFANPQAFFDGKQGHFADTPVTVSVDGKKVTIPAGGSIILKPGQSICVTPGVYHTWQAVPGKGDCILWEVSARNDDNVDNRFYEALPRIPAIEEDEAPEYLMFADYPKYTKFSYRTK